MAPNLMSEPLRTAHTHAGPLSDADRDARIEQLLLTGLDHYFSGRHAQAIDIWTRVAFLERGHGRARAYIERARSALAEQQREHEELLHSGVEAYHAGRLDVSRELLTRAIEQGGPSDTALVFLQRLSRVDAAQAASRGVASSQSLAAHPSPADAARWRLPLTIAASVLVAGAILLVAMPVASWLAEIPVAAPPVVAARAEPLPVVRASDMRLARAHALAATGHIAAALRTLERIDIADPARADADAFRVTLQRQLLAAAGADQVSATAADAGAGR
jgi:hypothetical protein